MLYSQGVPLENLGIPRLDGSAVEEDDRVIWQTFADHYYLFRGTPTGMWLNDELQNVFGVQSRLKSDTAQEIYDQIEEQLRKPEFKPRALLNSSTLRFCVQQTQLHQTLNIIGLSENRTGMVEFCPPFVPMQLWIFRLLAGRRRSMH